MKISQLKQDEFSLSHIALCFSELTGAERNFLSQKLLTVGSKVALDEQSLLAFLDIYQLERLICQWPNGPEKALLQEIENRQRMIWSGQNFSFDLTKEPIVYAILNVTPDSFYDGNQANLAVENVLKKAEEQLSGGASVLELGGKSSRPGYEDISPEQEWQRLKEPLAVLRKAFPKAVLAVDTDEAYVMERVLEAGADIINDIDGFDTADKLRVLKKYRPSVVVMNNGRADFQYSDNVFEELAAYFEHKTAELLACGLTREQICLDPGVGFYKAENPSDSLERVKSTEMLTRLGFPVMIAISRKSFLTKDFGLTEPERLWGTLMVQAPMLAAGGRVLRVHDSKESKALIEGFKLFERKG